MTADGPQQQSFVELLKQGDIKAWGHAIVAATILGFMACVLVRTIA